MKDRNKAEELFQYRIPCIALQTRQKRGRRVGGNTDSAATANDIDLRIEIAVRKIAREELSHMASN